MLNKTFEILLQKLLKVLKFKFSVEFPFMNETFAEVALRKS